jgi:hypothetical protein
MYDAIIELDSAGLAVSLRCVQSWRHGGARARVVRFKTAPDEQALLAGHGRSGHRRRYR